MPKPKPKYIDIFAGCGGLSTGLYCAGWHGLFAVEKNDDAFTTLRYNLIERKKHFSWPKWLPQNAWDINELLEKHEADLLRLRGKVSLVAGGPPCQGFSMAGKRNQDDHRNSLVKSYIKFIELVRPEAIIFENVHGFTVEFKESAGTKQYSSYVENALRRIGYKVSARVIDMSDYGVPQNRKRFILVAMRTHSPRRVFKLLKERKVTFLSEKNLVGKTTVFEAIGDLEKRNGTEPSPDSRGFQAGIYGDRQSSYQRMMRYRLSTQIRVPDSHRFVNHRPETETLHQELLDNAPVGRRLSPEDECVANINLNRRGVTILDRNGQSPTLTSIPDEMIHYCEPRILTVREHARLQSFPDWYEFKGKYTSGGDRRKYEVPRYTQVGNAVPPLFAEQIGRAILEVLNEHD